MIDKSLSVKLCGLAALALAWPCAAQTTTPRYTFNIGGGFSEPVRDTDGRLDTGFNIVAGGGINLAPYLGVMAEFGYNHLGLSSAALNAAGVPAGATRIYSVTLDPIVHFNPHGRFDAYVIGGGGFYRRTVEFTQPTVQQITAFDPFFGFFPALIPTNIVLGSFTQNKGGLNIGGGVEVRVRGDSNAKIFAEARYHYLFTTPVPTTILPVTFGFRW